MAEAQEVELFAIARSVNDLIDHKDRGRPRCDGSAADLFQAMTTVEPHLFSEPETAGLAPIFRVIGTRVEATDSRLVPTVDN